MVAIHQVKLTDLKGHDVARNLELQLLLRLNDQMSSGLKSAMKSAQTETKTLENSISGVATATARIKTTPIDRMTSALRTMRSAAGAAHESMLKVAKASASVASGVAAGGYVLSKPVGQTMDYSMRMAHASNTAFNKRDKLGRIAGKAELNSSIVNAVRVGGGTRDSGAETLDSIISSNGMSTRDAMASLPIFMKAATASGSDSTDLSTIGVRAMQTFKIKQKEMSAIMDIANEGGKAGGFELKDMAKWLPQQMAQSTNLGMSGKADFSKLVAWNQAAVITSGTKDEAGTNLRDLLMEINSPHFAKHLESVGVKNSEQYFLKSQENGVNKVDATVALMEQIVSKNKTYQALQA